eukprot:Plantae.Rhodophyta-Palmaria_palmata.ctg283.p1 GENE.Plantae.Rhodophyta-Palmaria_palmata.ctg283~~Plantae.Rhodophyta-Palmaria_palmata.ctg283.p1  ORF type:complete len:315 (+),score=12.88 Plantae.Rhodophyta-Palmaria_palmata.ctg283:632-1576(+)
MSPPDRDFLSRMRVAPSTLQEYDRDLRKFLDWGRRHRPTLLLTTAETWDETLTDFAIYTYKKFKGKKRQRVNRAKCGLEFYYPFLRGKLMQTKLSLDGWSKKTPYEQFEICPWPVALGIYLSLLTMGKPREGLAVLLAFDCYLRAADLDKLTMKRIIIDRDLSGPTKGCLRASISLQVLKRGRNQSVLVKRPFIRELLKNVREKIDDEEFFLSVSISQLRRLVKKALEDLNLAHMNLSLHSVRYGGANFDKLQGSNIEDVMQRGRWMSRKSIQRYLQEGLYLKKLAEIPKDLRENLERHAQTLHVRDERAREHM